MNRPIQSLFTSKWVVLTFSVIIFVTLSWAAWRLITQPALGILWDSDTGSVYHLAEHLEFQLNDTILTIDGIPFAESSFPFYEWESGDRIVIEYERAGERLTTTAPFDQPTPLRLIVIEMLLVFVSLAFWGTGTTVAQFRAAQGGQSFLFFIWCQLVALALALGNISNPTWVAPLTLALIWLIPPTTIHLHLIFPLNRLTPSVKRLLNIGYLLSLGGGIVSMLNRVTDVIAVPNALRSFFSILFYPWILTGLIIALIFLLYTYFVAPTVNIKRQVGLVALGGLVAIGPLITLSLIPQFVADVQILPTDIVLILLFAIPLAYGYAIARYKLIKLERYASRTASITLVITLLCVFYLAFGWLLRSILPASVDDAIWVDLVTVILPVVAFNPLHRRLENWVDYLLYGGWYDYSSVVNTVIHTLERSNNIETLADTLSTSIQKTMRVYWATLLLPNPDSHFAVMKYAGQLENVTLFRNISLRNELAQHLQASIHPVTTRELRKALEPSLLNSAETRLLNLTSTRLWIPINGLDDTIGLLILGSKYGDDVFDATDMEILNVVARQASIALQNVQLLNQLEKKVKENEIYQRQSVIVREEERKRIARELHDQIIQALIGLKYQIANLETFVTLHTWQPRFNAQSEQLQNTIGELIQLTRTLCHDLRPPALDLGFVPSIRSIVNRFEERHMLDVDLQIKGDRSIILSEDVALCLFRCTHEALMNIAKHAAATIITVQVQLNPGQVELAIQDNGLGFDVPIRLGTLMEDAHFGLVGMRERIELVHGHFDIISTRGEGTYVKICIPLDTESNRKREIGL